MNKLFKEVDKKVLISFLIIIAMLSTLAIYQIFATATIEMESDHNPYHEVNDGKYIPFAELAAYYDYFCCYHGNGQGDSHIPSYNNTIVTAGGQSASHPYLTQNDIGMQEFRDTWPEPSTNPYTGGPFRNETYSYYKVTGEYTATPMEAYILAEMVENDGPWSTYVQKAWWATEAGSKGPIKVPDNEFAAEARAFQDYILEVAGVTNASKLEDTEKITKYLREKVELGEFKCIDSETDTLKFKYPDIKYKPDWDEKVVGEKNEDGSHTFKNVTVAFDESDDLEDEQLYTIGPFSIEYIESFFKVNTEDNNENTENGDTSTGEEGIEHDINSEGRSLSREGLIEIGGEDYIQFAGISDAHLYTNSSSEELKRRTADNPDDWDWDFRWIKGERTEDYDGDDIIKDNEYEFPHSNEEFYIIMKFIPGATEITEFAFDFKYMNAGGKYQDLQGTYFIASWTDRSKNNYESYTEYCGAENCTGHLKWRHISTDYWIQLDSLEERISQRLALGVIGCRWYEKAELRMNDISFGYEITILKDLVDENGNSIPEENIDKNKRFEFDIYINNEFWKRVPVKAGGATTVTYTPKEGETSPPSYRVEEVATDGYEIYTILNSAGTLGGNEDVKVYAKNLVKEKKGVITIYKDIVDKNGNIDQEANKRSADKNEKFIFNVYINDKFWKSVPVLAGDSTTTVPYVWKDGESNPKFRVEEVSIPDGYEYQSLNPKIGTLIEDVDIGVEVYCKNKMKDEPNHGTLQLNKIAIGNIQNLSFKFKVTIDNDVYEPVISASTGWTWTCPKTYEWYGDNAPYFTVYEYPTEGARKVNITPDRGYLSSTTYITPVEAINDDGEPEWEEGSIRITKQLNGNVISNEKFEFEIYLDGQLWQTVKLKAGETSPVYTKKWQKGTTAPAYEVKERPSDDYRLVSMSDNYKGTLSNQTVNVTATNEPKWEYGKIAITKKIDGNYVSSDTYTFSVTVDGYEPEILLVKSNTTVVTQNEYKWEKGKPAPKYKVEEINIPEGSELVKIENGEGTLSSEGNAVQAVTVINKLTENKGKIKVTKRVVTDEKMQNEAITDTFKINIRINGTFELNGESIVGGTRTLETTLSAGGTYESPEIKWWGNNAPTYTVTETDIPEGWILEDISNGKGSLVKDQTVEVVVINSFTTRIVIDLTMEMAGMVWEDEYSNDKPPAVNGIYDGEEIGIDGVEVFVYKVIYNGNGQEISRGIADGYELDGETELTWPLITENGGYWKAPRMSVPAVTDEEYRAGYKGRLDIEFVYDGQTYEPTKFLAKSEEYGIGPNDIQGKAEEYRNATTKNRDNWLNNSMALDYDRIEVDNRIAEVAGDQPIDVNGETVGKVKGTDGQENRIDYTSTDYTYGINNASRKVSKVTTLDENGIALPVFKAKARTSVGYLLYPFDERIHLESYDKYIDPLGAVEVYHYSATYNYTKNINLGLVKRDEANVALTKDLYDANVIVNEKLLNYKFNKALMDMAKLTGDDDLMSTILSQQIEIENKGIKYALELYESDYIYRSEIYNPDNNSSSLTTEEYDEQKEMYEALKAFYNSMNMEIDSTELDIYLTYVISVYNESPSYDATINLVEDYFDSSFTLVDTTVQKYVQTANGVTIDGVTEVAKASDYSVTRQTTSGVVSGSEKGDITWKTETSNINGSDGVTYNKMSTDSLKGVKLASGEKIDIYVTFKLDKSSVYNGVSDCIALGEKHNIAEIGSYSTYYKGEDRIAGKIDRNSAPSNINIIDHNEKSYYEDDTDAAPILNINLHEDNLQREINGIAWEDKKTEVLVDEFDQNIGNGKRDSEEGTIGGLTTKLVEKVRVLNIKDGSPETNASGDYVYTEYDFIWPTGISFSFLGHQTIEDLSGFDSTTTTSIAPNAENKLEEGQYKFSNVPAGNYVVRFVYGDKVVETAGYEEDSPAIYNGQDYKTTVYQAGFDNYNANSGGYIGNEWHDLKDESLVTEPVSDARDDEARRLDVISKSRIITNVNGTVLSTANFAKEEDTEFDFATSLEDYYTEKGYDTADFELHKALYDYKMSADTAKLNIEIENINELEDLLEEQGLDIKYFDGEVAIGGIVIHKVEGQSEISGVVEGITEIEYIVNNIDVGLIERSKTELVLDKQIENIKLTTSDNKTILYADYEITYSKDMIDEDNPFGLKIELKDSSIGTDQLQSVYKNELEPNAAQGFRYINVDEQILQGTTIQIGYLFTALNIGEIDRVVAETFKELKTTDDILVAAKDLRKENKTYTKPKKATEFNGRAICGTYLGNIYYKGEEGNKPEEVVTTKVCQIIDYVDNNAVFASTLNTGVDNSWRNTTTEELKGTQVEDRILEKSIYTAEDETDIQLVDSDGMLYETENRNNIITSIDNVEDTTSHTNKGFIVDLVPYLTVDNDDKYKSDYDGKDYGYTAQMRLTTTRFVSQETDADELEFENMSEIIKIENIVGRRDMEAVPGNANPKKAIFEESLEERDTSATEIITLSPPTGINTIDVIKLQLILTVAAALFIVIIGIVVIKKKVLK